MIIKRVELEDFRIYKGLNIIDLTPEPDKNIYIVSGKNGFGKTTFLMSLVWCLYGRQMQEVDDLYKKEIADQGGYPKYIVNSLNRQAMIEGKSSFSVKLVIADAIVPELTCNEISIRRTYNIRTSEEDLEILIDGFENELIRGMGDDKMRGEENFIRDYLLPIEIAKFFFFDAEKIVNLAEVNTPEQRRKLSKAYSEILGIKKYEDAKVEIEDTQLRIRARTATAKERELLNTLELDITFARLQIADNLQRINNLQEKQVDLRFETNELQKKLIRIGNLITVEELDELRKKEAELTDKLRELQNDLAKSYEIIPFALAGNKLNEVVQQVNSEAELKEAKFKQENVQEAIEKIKDDLLSAFSNAPTGTTSRIHSFYSETISKLIKTHFFADVPDLPSDFKVIHDFSDSEQGELDTFLKNLRLSFREEFKRVNYEYNQTRNELQLIRRKIADAESIAEDAIVRADRERKQELDTQIDQYSQEIGGYKIQNNGFQNGIIQKEKQREELRKKLAVSANDKEKDKLTEELSKRLKDYITLYKQRKRKSLEGKILSGLQTLMHKQNFVQKVEVEIIGEDIDIQLLNQRGDTIRKESLSKGEQQLYATALLYGLVEESDIDFPIFIDSPMQKFDEQHAENIVRYFYPKIADQVILFPLINKELSEQEYQFLQPNVARAYLIVNQHSDHSTFEEIPPEELFDRYNALYNK